MLEAIRSSNLNILYISFFTLANLYVIYVTVDIINDMYQTLNSVLKVMVLIFTNFLVVFLAFIASFILFKER